NAITITGIEPGDVEAKVRAEGEPVADAVGVDAISAAYEVTFADKVPEEGQVYTIAVSGKEPFSYTAENGDTLADVLDALVDLIADADLDAEVSGEAITITTPDPALYAVQSVSVQKMSDAAPVEDALPDEPVETSTEGVEAADAVASVTRMNGPVIDEAGDILRFETEIGGQAFDIDVSAATDLASLAAEIEAGIRDEGGF